MLRKKISEAAEALEQASNALGGFKRLQISEAAAIQRRLVMLRAEVGFVSTREREAQEMYRRTKAELDELTANGTNGYH
jgi:pre-mRNA-splicing factor CDC5/CEF1